jgi:vacuolar protein sorting-associated protein 13D
MDKNYQEKREQLRTGAQSSGGHILAGVKGFGNGLFGAVTSIFTQPYDGFKEDGIEVLYNTNTILYILDNMAKKINQL